MTVVEDETNVGKVLLTWLRRYLHERHFLLQVGSAVDPTRLHHKLVALLQLSTTDDTGETMQMVNRIEGSHHQISRWYRF